jgi:hypothetical protein
MPGAVARNTIPISGGTTTGMVAGKILNGGADYQLAASGGTTDPNTTV